MAGFLIALWCASVAAKLVAAVRLIETGLFRRYPALLVLFCASACQHAILIALVQRPVAARFWYSVTSPAMLLFDAAAIIGVFWVSLESFPALRNPGVALLSMFALLAGFGAYVTRAFAVPSTGWTSAWQVAVLLQRHAGLILIAILAATRFLVSGLSYRPIRPSARRAADILIAQAIFVIWAAPVFTIATGARYPVIAQSFPLIGGTACALLFAILLTPASDRLPERRPSTDARAAETKWLALGLEIDGLERFTNLIRRVK